MGMELQYAMNHFSTLPNNFSEMVVVGSDTMDGYVDSKKLFPRKDTGVGFQHTRETIDRETIDRKIDVCSRDSIRKTMLKQERIFKDQVSHLHHLYQVQKRLMAELSKELRLHSLTRAASGVISDSRSELQSSRSTSLMCHSSSWIEKPNSITLLNSGNYHHQMIAGPHMEAICDTSKETFKVAGSQVHGLHALEIGLPVNMAYIQNKSPIAGSQVHGRIGLERAYLFAAADADLDLTLSIGNGTNKNKSRDGGEEKRPIDLALEEAKMPILSNFTRP